MNTEVKTISEYIAGYPPATQEILHKVYAALKEVLPEATEKIAYGIPTFWQKKNIVHFGGYAHHLGYYPGPVVIEAFKDKLQGYEMSRGTIQFPLDKPIPYDLIKEIALYRLKQLS